MWSSFQLKNITLYFFFVGLLFVFEILRMQTTLSFSSGVFWRSIVKWKTKETFCKPFVSLKDEVSITQLFLTAASLAQVDNAPNEADANLFCCDTRGLDWRSVKSLFFFVLFFFLFQKPSSCLSNWIAVFTGRDLDDMFFFSFHCDVGFWRAKHQ